jgi:hypothetical protein
MESLKYTSKEDIGMNMDGYEIVAEYPDDASFVFMVGDVVSFKSGGDGRKITQIWRKKAEEN